MSSVPRGPNSRFGWSLDFVDDIILITDLDAGVGGGVYVFRYLDSAWNFERLLSEDVSTPYGSVAFDGEVVVVGAPATDIPGVASTAGAAFVYRRSTSWSLEQQLVATLPNGDADGGLNAAFGSQLAVAGQTILATSAYTFVDPHQNAGAVYVFVDE